MTDDTSDLMLGAEPIARFLSMLFDGEEITAIDVYNWVSRGTLPHSHLGAKIVASKRQLRAFFYEPKSPAMPNPRRRYAATPNPRRR
jgi:hypothetical protein